MNRENLQRMADYIRTVPPENFNMELWRTPGSEFTPECNSVGCVIGHCTVLDTPERLKTHLLGSYNFNWYSWSGYFTGIGSWMKEWNWCFDFQWHNTDNTPTGAADRIEWLLNNGLPENWPAQMSGDAPLCYKK